VCERGCGLRTPSRCRDTVREHTRLACKPSEIETRLGLASSSGEEANFIAPMYHQCSGRAQLVEPTRGTRMLPYAETLMLRWKKLPVGSIPAPSDFSIIVAKNLSWTGVPKSGTFLAIGGLFVALH